MTPIEDYFSYASDYWSKIATFEGDITPGPQWDDADRDAKSLLEGIDPLQIIGASVVEIGSGEGRLSIPLSRHCRRYVGLDITPTCIKRSLALGLGGNVEFRLMKSFEDIAEAKPDLVVSYTVFQHLPEPILNGMLYAIHAALPKNGLLSFQLDSIGRLPQYRYDQVPDLDLWNSRWYPDDYLADKLAVSGFTVERRSDHHSHAWLVRK